MKQHIKHLLENYGLLSSIYLYLSHYVLSLFIRSKYYKNPYVLLHNKYGNSSYSEFKNIFCFYTS